MSRVPLLLTLLAGAPAAQELVWHQPTDLYSTVESSQWPGPEPRDVEAADDFVFSGAVTRVIAHGNDPLHAPPTLAIDGVWVRFYAVAAGAPGALQHEVFLPEGAPGFVHAPYPTKLDVTLPAPFQATGAHFVSVQLVTPEPNGWRWWSSKTHAPQGAPAHIKDEQKSGVFEPYATVLGYPSDLAFELWGDDGSPIDDPVDPCGAWEELVVPPIPPTFGTTILRDVAVLANDDAWAVGDPVVDVGASLEYKTYALHWDGASWSVVPTPNPGVMPDPYQATGLQAVDGTSAGELWAVGNWERQDSIGFVIEQPLVLRWNGAGWDHLIVPNTDTDTFTYDVKVLGPDDAWIVGGGFEPLAIHWDGSGFDRVPTPDFGPGGTPGYDWTAVDGAASNDVWAVGGGSDGDFSSTTVIAHWDGSSWTRFEGPEPGFARRLFDLHARASDDVWAVGQYEEIVGSQVKYFAFALHWDGSGWALHDGSSESIGSLSVHAFAPDDVYTAGAQIHHYDGTSWSVVDDLGQLTGDNLFVTVAGLDAVEPCHLFAAGRQDVAGRLVPFTARQQGPHVWATETSACDAAPGVPDGIQLVVGPKLGKPFTVAIGDPNAAAGVTPGATGTFWAVSLKELPCGVLIPGAGVGGAPASLRVDVAPAPLLTVTGPKAWGGIAAPGIHVLPIPDNPALAGLELVTQGLLLDPTQPAPVRLTDALFVTLGL